VCVRVEGEWCSRSFFCEKGKKCGGGWRGGGEAKAEWIWF